MAITAGLKACATGLRLPQARGPAPPVQRTIATLVEIMAGEPPAMAAGKLPALQVGVDIFPAFAAAY